MNNQQTPSASESGGSDDQAEIQAITARIAADRTRTIEGLKDLLITPEQIDEIMGDVVDDREKLEQLRRWVESGNETIIARLEQARQQKANLNTGEVAISPEQLLQVLQSPAGTE